VAEHKIDINEIKRKIRTKAEEDPTFNLNEKDAAWVQEIMDNKVRPSEAMKWFEDHTDKVQNLADSKDDAVKFALATVAMIDSFRIMEVTKLGPREGQSLLGLIGLMLERYDNRPKGKK
jgi:hypothetical protein